MASREGRLRALARDAGQEHLFAPWDLLDESRRAALLDRIEEIDFELAARLAELVRAPPPAEAPATLEPPDVFPLELERSPEQQRLAREAILAGEESLRRDRVGFVVVAGGQASRLGHEGPKGAFRIGPVSGWSLFEIHARRLLAAGRRYAFRPAWYVMTSRGNDAETRALFAGHGGYGLPSEDVVFFTQAMVPAFDPGGRILFSAADAPFMAPNGHGGTLSALERSGALADARRRGIEHLSYFQVDNPLARPADPLFVGLHALAGARMSSKVVGKRDAGEKVGVLARAAGRVTCIEYSDLPAPLRGAREPGGALRFRAGNIGIHVLERSFVEELTAEGPRLPWHLARKRMQVWEDGRTVEREGVKLETFIFDALARSPASVVLEVERGEEFSPVKNRTGEDSPDSARADLCRLHARWVRAAGLALPAPHERGVHPVEVDPLLAEDEATFVRSGARVPEARGGGHLYR